MLRVEKFWRAKREYVHIIIEFLGEYFQKCLSLIVNQGPAITVLLFFVTVTLHFRWEDNIRMDLEEISSNVGNWVDSAQDRSPCECSIEPPGSISHGVS